MTARNSGLVILVLAAAAICAGQTQSRAFHEYEVKAEFIERFTRFIEWPDDQWRSSSQPFVIGMAGNIPFQDELAERVPTWRIKDRPVVLRQLRTIEEVESCHIVFIAADHAERLDEILALTQNRSILTIADTEGFADRGVLINFVLVKKKVQFEINPDAVDRSGLVFRAKLLMVAKLVESPEQP